MIKIFKNKKILFLTLFLFLLINAFAWWQVYGHEDIGGDAEYYHQVAINLSSGGGYTYKGEKTMTREPGYPFFLAMNYHLFGVQPDVIKFEQIFILFLSSIISFYLLQNIFKNCIPYLISGLIVAYPIFTIFALHIVSETLAMFLVLLFLFLFHLANTKNNIFYYFLAGLALSILVMVKNMYFFMIPIFILAILFWNFRLNKSNFLKGIIFSLGFFIVIFPWMTRNYINFDNPMLATRSGVLLYAHAVKTDFDFSESKKYILSSLTGEYIVRRFIDHDYDFEKDGQGVNLIHNKRQDIAEREGELSYDEMDKKLSEESVEIFKKNPIKYFLWGIFEINNLNSPMIYYERHISMFHNGLEAKTLFKTSLVLLLRLAWYFFVIFVFYGMYCAIKEKKVELYSFVIFVLYTNFIAFFLQGIPRFLAPILFIYFTFFIFSFSIFIKKRKKFVEKTSNCYN